MDIAGDDAGVWMTYDELAVARDIKRDGARRLAQRHRWRRHAGNDGLPVFWCRPNGCQVGAQAPRDRTRRHRRDDKGATAPSVVAPDVTGVVAALQGAIGHAATAARCARKRGATNSGPSVISARAEAQEAAQAAEAIRRADAADEDRRARPDASPINP